MIYDINRWQIDTNVFKTKFLGSIQMTNWTGKSILDILVQNCQKL